MVMQLRNVKCTKQYFTKKQIINKIEEIHIPCVRDLLSIANNNCILKTAKVKAICDVYNYIYYIFRDLYECKDHHKYNELIKTI
jgi:hypothetical protein